MSDGLSDAVKHFFRGLDKSDTDPLFTDDEVDRMLKNFESPSIPWLDFANWKPKEYKCSCGSDITYGPNGRHSEWCDKVKK